MAPSRIVTLKLPRRKDGPASPPTEDSIASSNGDGHNVALTGKADEDGNRPHGHGMSEFPSPCIKQEPAFGAADNPSAHTSNMKKTCDTNPIGPAATEGKHSMPSCHANAHVPDSMDIDNGSGAKPSMRELLPLANANDNRGDVDASFQTVGPTNGTDLSEPDQATTTIKANIEIANKGPNQGKRKRESGSNEGPPTKDKPALARYRKPPKGTFEATKYVMSHANPLVLSGNNAKLPQDTELNLPPICQAPLAVQKDLRALEEAALKLPHANKKTIKTQVKVLGGLCHAFQNLQPCLIERDGEPRVDDFKWKVQGMSTPLHSHQMLGSAIMIVIERDENQGSGLLFDFMGFGKTVQMLACVVSNPVRPKKPGKKGQHLADGSATTLVVVPKSAATQWVEEVKLHTKPQLSVVLWTKQTEITRGATLAADILVVTYDQVRAMRKACETGRTPSLLFDVCFQRIVLDEAHRIKNRHSGTFEACMSLEGKHRWALTGTPMPNGVHELWPLLKFIRHHSVQDFAHFKRNYLTKKSGTKSKGGAEYEELSKLLLPISIMRTPGHQFCGIPLVSLPQDHAIKEVVPLGAEEKVILAYLEGYIMTYIKKKCRGRSSYTCLRERFMRYRQFSASPLLLEGPIKDGLWTINQVRLMKQEAQNTGAEQTPIIDLFERWILEPKRPHPAPTGDRKVDSMLAKADLMICPFCSGRQINPQLADCGHIWCAECVEERRMSRTALKREISCPKCKRLIGETRPHKQEEIGHEKDAMRCQKGVDHNGFQPADDEGSTLFQFLDEHPEAPIPLSAKMKRMLELILEWQAKAPKDKIIVFVRFIDISRILGRLLQAHGIGCLYFVGQMNSDQRRDARAAFEDNEAIKVLMVSITTGGEALNLTMANRCIIYDPWWHVAAEEQAFGRVNRIGQEKDTHCVRLFAKGTIDDRIRDLQDEKKKQQSAIAELEAGKGLTAKTLRRILDGQVKKEGGSNGGGANTDSEDSGEDDEDDYSDSEYEDPNDVDWTS